MKFFNWAKDGGPESHVNALYVIELKSLFSITILHFHKGSREAFHSHAFNAWTLWLKGTVKEFLRNGEARLWGPGQIKYTPRSCFHRVSPVDGSAWALSIRGPWVNTWNEYKASTKTFTTLGHGREVLNEVSLER